jgi:adenylosuccinate synthase
VALLHLDTLTGLKELKICKAYMINEEEKTFFPTDAGQLSQAQAIYETVPGWDEDITDVDDFHRLPASAQDYVGRIEEHIKIPVTIIGVGPKRSQTILR